MHTIFKMQFEQLVRNFQYAVHQCSSDQVAYSNLCVELLNMADLLLEGYSSHLESLKGSEKFDMHIHQYTLLRRKIIQPFSKYKASISCG
jgi:hypothetical protein